MTPEEFRDRVFELARGEDNTYTVAARALNEVKDPADWEMIARLTAPPYISNMLKTHVPPARPATASKGKGDPQPVFTDANGNRRVSSRQVEFVDWWARRLEVKIRTATGTKSLGHCTAADLDFVAEYRRQKAQEDLSAAIRYEKLAQLMRDQGKTTVAEVDAETGRAILDG
jgi:hypothetical protein